MGRAKSTICRWESSDGNQHRMVRPQDIHEIVIALYMDEGDWDAIASNPRVVSAMEADEYLLMIAAGYLPRGAQSVLQIPVIAALAMAWDTLDKATQEQIEFEVDALITRSYERMAKQENENE